MPLTSGPVQAQGTGRCAGGGRWFTRRRRVAGRGIGLGAVTVTLGLAVFLIQAESRQSELLPGGEQKEQLAANAPLRLPVARATCHRPPADISPFLPTAVPGVPEALGKGVVVDLQLCNLRDRGSGTKSRPGSSSLAGGHPEVSGYGPRSREPGVGGGVVPPGIGSWEVRPAGKHLGK